MKLKSVVMAVLVTISTIGTSSISYADETVTFYFVRHGKTIGNTVERLQGWSDSPITPEGKKVVEHLGLGFKAQGVKFKAVHSSDLGRARDTAQIILEQNGQTNLTINQTWQLREANFGSYEEETYFRTWNDAALYLRYKSSKELLAAIELDYFKLADLLAAIKELETYDTSESYDDIKKRMQAYISEIAAKEAKNGGGNILVTGHGMAIGIFLTEIDQPHGLHMQNAAVSKVTYKNGKFKLETFADMSYVEQGAKLQKSKAK